MFSCNIVRILVIQLKCYQTNFSGNCFQIIVPIYVFVLFKISSKKIYELFMYFSKRKQRDIWNSKSSYNLIMYKYYLTKSNIFNGNGVLYLYSQDSNYAKLKFMFTFVSIYTQLYGQTEYIINKYELQRPGNRNTHENGRKQKNCVHQRLIL